MPLDRSADGLACPIRGLTPMVGGCGVRSSRIETQPTNSGISLARRLGSAMNADLLADYRRRGWALVPIPVGQKRPVAADWQNRDWPEAHFCTGGNVGVIFGSRSGEVVDVDLDCGEALELADLFLPTIGAVFGRPSKPHSHRLYVAGGAVFEAFGDPIARNTLLEIRANGTTGGRHLTIVPPSVADGEHREWCSDVIEPAVLDARETLLRKISAAASPRRDFAVIFNLVLMLQMCSIPPASKRKIPERPGRCALGLLQSRDDCKRVVR
jgi:hypothetical protein